MRFVFAVFILWLLLVVFAVTFRRKRSFVINDDNLNSCVYGAIALLECKHYAEASVVLKACMKAGLDSAELNYLMKFAKELTLHKSDKDKATGLAEHAHEYFALKM